MSIKTLSQNKIIDVSVKTTATILGMVLLPIVVHLVPFNGPIPLGAFLLPMFLAPLVAAFHLSPVGLIFAAFTAPLINHALTGMPSSAMLPGLTAELLLFSLFVWWLHQRLPRIIGISVLALLSAKLTVWTVGWILGSGISLTPALFSILRATPGVLMLLLVEFLLHQNRK